MPTLKRREISKKEAQARTAKHRRDFIGMRRSWVRLGKDVEESVRLQVPAKLGMTMRDWLDVTFEESSSHLFRQLQNLRALKGVPEKTLETIPEASAHELTRLNEKDRKDPVIVQKAVQQPPKEFKQTVAKIREEKYGITPSRFKTFAVAVPIEVHELLIEAQKKIARVLQVDIEGEDVRAKNLITVWECIASLVNSTDEAWLKVETEGGGPLEEYQIQKANGAIAHEAR